MPGPFTHQKIENWVIDFCISDHLRPFPAPARDIAGSLLQTFLKAACDARTIEPEDLEESDIRTALLGPVAQLAISDEARPEVPALCAALLAYLEEEGRLGGGKLLAAFTRALSDAYLEQASGKPKPIVRAGARLGRNDPCPCGSGKKYKKCCMRE